jgi:hypothetical protein
MTKRQRDKAAAAAPTDFAESVIRHGGEKPKPRRKAKKKASQEVFVALDGAWDSTMGTAEDVRKRKFAGGFSVAWSVKGIGYGEFSFWVKDGKLRCDNECMSKDFIKLILGKLVDDAILVNP